MILAALTPTIDAAEHSAHGWIGLIPAAVAVVLCLWTRRPLAGLATGLAIASLLYLFTSRGDIGGLLLIPPWLAIALLGTLLGSFGALMGLWQLSGSLPALVDRFTRRIGHHPSGLLRGTWLLGVLLFQGGGLSAFLVGSSVREPARQAGLRPVQTAYVVDSTAAPVAMLLPLNAWFFYLSSLLGLAAIPPIADSGARVWFIAHSLPLSFFCMLAVALTGLYALGWHWIGGPVMATIDGTDRSPRLPETEASRTIMPVFYASLIVLIIAAIGIIILLNFQWLPLASAIAFAVGGGIALHYGWTFANLKQALLGGFAVVLLPLAILTIAISLGAFTQALGLDQWLQGILAAWPWPWLFPVAVFIGAAIVSLATGTSWGSLAILLPALLPLAPALAESGSIPHLYWFLACTYAAMVNGAIFGDLCSPLSDTTILSSTATGCNVVDHVRTQWFPSSLAALLACLAWAALSAVLFL